MIPNYIFLSNKSCNCIRINVSIFHKAIVRTRKPYSTVKYNIQLIPDVKSNLDSGTMKHRKHPGIRKLAPIKLPSFVEDAIYRLVSNQNESLILKEAHAMCNHLLFRRLPVEVSEIQDKIFKTSLELESDKENMPENLKKTKIIQLKKQIKMEMGRWKPLEYDQLQSLIYLAGRASPNYASIYRVFTEILTKYPSFQPTTFFDFGSGVGSSIWAANSIWKDSIKEYFCVDSSVEMNELSQYILTEEGTEKKFVKNINYRQFLPASDTIKYDLVVSAFSLIDLPSAKERLQVIDTLWRKTTDMLVIIEYGNLSGFNSVLDARDYILHIENNSNEQSTKLSSGVHVVCPCPHDSGCPMLKTFKDPCGLNVPYQTIFPRHSKSLKRDWISYVVLKKGPKPQNESRWPRLIKPVIKKSKHVYCNLCCNDGQLRQIIITKGKHGRHVYRSSRSSSLGDLLPVDISELSDKNNCDVLDESLNDGDEEGNKT